MNEFNAYVFYSVDDMVKQFDEANKKINGELNPEKEKANKELEEIKKVEKHLNDKEKALKERLDKAYAQKTEAQNKISECEQKIIAGETYQDMGEELRDNAIEKVEDSKDTGESKWYTPLLSLFK